MRGPWLGAPSRQINEGRDGRVPGATRNMTDYLEESDMAQGQDRIVIHGPRTDGTYVVEFQTAAGESLAISIPRTETAVIKYFQARMPNGLVV